MTIEEIRALATATDDQLEVGWDRLTKIEDREQFEVIMQNSMEYLADLEYVHSLLDDREVSRQLRGVIESELYAGYQLQNLWDRYQTIQQLIS